MYRDLVANYGSIQNIERIPKELKELYKTTWEISQKTILDHAADRGAFVDQSQSTNIWMANPTYQMVTSMHFYGWKKGIKTGMYYLRTKPATYATQFTLSPETGTYVARASTLPLTIHGNPREEESIISSKKNNKIPEEEEEENSLKSGVEGFRGVCMDGIDKDCCSS
jgi:ribonucleoside-diphosphate reductase subunit M1